MNIRFIWDDSTEIYQPANSPLEPTNSQENTSLDESMVAYFLDNVIEENDGKKERLYWVNWTRSCIIQIMIVIYCINDVDLAYGQSSVDPQYAQWISKINRYIFQIGAPIFYYVMGVSVRLFDFEVERPFSRFLMGRIKKTLLPVVFGVVFIVLPQYYIRQQWTTDGMLDEYTGADTNFITQMRFQLRNDFLIKLGTVYFLLFWFVIMLLNYPLIKWTNRRSKKKPYDSRDRKTIFGQIIALTLWDRFTYMVQATSEDYYQHMLPVNALFALSHATYFVVQFRLQRIKMMSSTQSATTQQQQPVSGSSGHQFNGCIGLYFIGMVCQVLFCLFIPEHGQMTMCTVCIQFCFFSTWFAQGLFVSSWRRMLHADLHCVKQNTCYPILLGFIIFIGYGFCQPGNHSKVNERYMMYPMYHDYFLNIEFIVGAWLAVYILLWISKQELNRQFNVNQFRFVTQSSLWSFLTYTLFLNIFIAYVVVPNKEYVHFTEAVIMTVSFTLLSGTISYWALTKALQLLCDRD